MKDAFAEILKCRSAAESDAIIARIHSSVEAAGTQVRCGWHVIEPNTFFLDADSERRRESTDLEMWVSEWFEKMILGMQNADDVIARLCAPSEHGHDN